MNLVERGSQTAKDGFKNEDDIVKKFNNWKKDIVAQKWLVLMKYDLKEIEFIANAESENEIEFYSFDFDYNTETKIFSAEVLLNKEGKATHKFKPGTHNIAVKVVDSEGLEAIEIIKIKINGKVERED